MSNQIRILCVDDERNVLRALERIFLDDDYEILTACSGEEGLELLDAAAQVQVVISDYRMPGMNGVEFLKKVFKTHPETIRIVLSGYADTAAVVAAINEGKIYKFIPKPWNDDELRVTVAKALETFAIQRKNQLLAEELRCKSEELCELNAHLKQHAQECNCEFMQQNHASLHAALILEQLPIGVIALEDGILLQMNRQAALMLQVNQQEVLGKKLSEALPAQLGGLAGALAAGRDAFRMDAADGGVLQIQAVSSVQDGRHGVILTMTRGAKA